MSYATTVNRPNPVAALGALGVPAAFGALLVIGLAIKTGVIDKDNGLEGFIIEPTIIEEPPEVEPVETTTDTVVEQQTYTPTPRPHTPITFGESATEPLVPYTGPIVDPGPVGPIVTPTPPPPLPKFDPVSAAPRGRPGEWVTDADYRSTWINRGYEGLAGFRVNIDTNGRVTNCSITSSTGYSALDEATCRLIERRARFTPARNGDGLPVAGSYSSSVMWQIPE